MGSEMLDACQEMDRMENKLRVRSTSSSEALKRTLSSNDRLYTYIIVILPDPTLAFF